MREGSYSLVLEELVAFHGRSIVGDVVCGLGAGIVFINRFVEMGVV